MTPGPRDDGRLFRGDLSAPEEDQPDGELLVFPTALEPPPSSSSCLEEAPPEVQAWIEHAAGDPDLQARLESLADSLAEREMPCERRRAAGSSGYRRALLLAAAAILLGVLAWQENHPRPVMMVEDGAPAPIADATPAAVPPPEIVPEEIAPPILPEPAPAARRPTRLARSFDGDGDSRPLAVMAGVDVLLDGHLELSGTPSSPRLALQGSATIDVTPGSVKDLVVDSGGANVRVLGTRFTVAESATGTSVSVERGKVAVQCVVGEPSQLTAGQERACPKPSAGGMLVYIKQLKQSAAPQERVIEAAERGLSYTVSQPALRSPLQLERIEALAALGREPEAREAAQACVESCEAVYREKAQELSQRLGLLP